MAQATMMKVKDPKNPPETIVEQPNKKGALVKYYEENCQKCEYKDAKCRFHDVHGLKCIQICVMLYGMELAKPDLGLLKTILETGTIEEMETE